MSRPKAPEVRTKTQAEKDAAAAARAGYELETEAKETASQCSASPLDAVSEALWSVVGDSLFQALVVAGFRRPATSARAGGGAGVPGGAGGSA